MWIGEVPANPCARLPRRHCLWSGRVNYLKLGQCCGKSMQTNQVFSNISFACSSMYKQAANRKWVKWFSWMNAQYATMSSSAYAKRSMLSEGWTFKRLFFFLFQMYKIRRNVISHSCSFVLQNFLLKGAILSMLSSTDLSAMGIGAGLSCR